MARRPWLFAVLFLLCLPALASAQGTPDGAAAGPDAASLERHLDGMVRYAMEEHHLPGVVVSVVHGDSLLLARGWGRARLRPDVPVDPHRTLFRVGSISKTVTFTGVMQQVESGRLRLDEDVATYLEDVEIRGSDRYGPITMTHLMTHTPGFEATPLDGSATSLDEDRSPNAHVRKYQPARVRPPGELASYSNFGVDLAGKVLQDVSGVEFAAYMDRNVLEPLDMHRSSFRDDPGEPADGYLPPDLAEDRAIGYYWSGGRFRSYGGLFLRRGAYPSASLSATAVDIASFMRAHLHGGAVAGSRVLAPETTERMHRVAFRNADGLMGNAHGFWSRRLAGFRTLEHGGSVLGFRSNLVLVPELDFGIFVSTNGADGRELVTRLPRMVLEHAFGGRSARPGPDAPGTERAAAYSGVYLGTRRGYTTLGKLYGMMASTATVSVTESGDLLVTGLGEPRRYGRVEGDLFAEISGDRSIAFEVDDGRASRFLTATQAYERVGFWQTPRAFFLVMLLGAAVLASALVGFWMRRGRASDPTDLKRWASASVGVTAVLWLTSVGALVVRMAGPGPPGAIQAAHFPDTLATVALRGTLVSAVLTGICVLGLVPIWRRRSWGIGRALRHTGVVAAMVAMTFMLWQWNAIGMQLVGG